MTEAIDASFEALLGFLQQSRGLDFTAYKRPTLARRLARRLQILGLSRFEDYRDYLEVHPEEYALLFNTILINVTSFFRDEAAWEFLRAQVVPRILEAKRERDSVRVWSAGCASGQEAYSLAMVLAEAMGADAFRERAKIYATDIDEEALGQARLASYTPKDMEALDPALRDRYFDAGSGRYVFRADLRRTVIFGRHDLLQDAPISHLDLLVCRNTLMYFNAETQSGILQRFHFALNGGAGGGFLFLGRAEMLLSHASLFSPLELKHRVFARVSERDARAPVRAAAAGAEIGEDAGMRNARLRELALDDAPAPRILIDAEGNLAAVNARARALFSINPRDVGRPLQDLEISYRPLELRTLIEQAYAERRSVTRAGVERRFGERDGQVLDVVVAPHLDEGQNPLGASVTFVDVTRYSRLAEELQRSREEIQTTGEELQSANEELETTNEELQSSNEELETTNEELQSTNEELETMNEELQSTNEELQTLNEELRQRTEESGRLNAFLESVLAGLRSAAIVVNQELHVIMWNARAEDLWGVRADEAQGRSLLNLDIGLPVAELRARIRPALLGEAGHAEFPLDAVNRRGKKIRCHVVCTPLISPGGKREGMILLIDESA
jgi:two-component system, chemotaxis family, CheB/CheR fusion protein